MLVREAGLVNLLMLLSRMLHLKLLRGCHLNLLLHLRNLSSLLHLYLQLRLLLLLLLL